MAFMTSFARTCRMTETNETNEKTLSSVAKFISLGSKLTRASRFSKSSQPDSADLSQDEETASQDGGFSSTDAGDDISPTYVDFDDFASTSSDDDEASCENNAPSPRNISDVAAPTCIYSIMMLLRLRSAVCEEDECDDAAPVRYGTRSISDLPAYSTQKAKSPNKAPASDAAESWRSGASTPGDSWRQILPADASNSWVAQQRKREVPDDDENVTRAARSILNKLTVEKFDSLFEQLVTCGIKHPRHISMLMREVFEKATTQHHFIPMYAELCVKLEKDPRIAAVVEEADQDQLQNFRRLLLNQCQHVFEQLLELGNVEADVDPEIVFCRKQQALGNMKLIGQLLVHGMLSPDLFTECCDELLRKRTQCPEALESLVALMMVAGPKFDHRDWQHYQMLEKILSNMETLTKDKSVQPRLRFLLRDTLDARRAGWPQFARGSKAPAKLEEVRIAQATEAQQKEESPKNCASEGNKKKVVRVSPKAEPIEVAPVAAAAAPKEGFQIVNFRRELASIFADLASSKSIPAAVQRVRLQHVPVEFQADQFVDILTRIVEERRGAVRRCQLAFIAGLGAAESSAFDRQECLAGIGLFFKHVYPELCNEVHRLPAIMRSEFMPTVLTVFPAADLNKVVPAAMKK